MTPETPAAQCTLPLCRPQHSEHPQRHPAAEEDASPSTRHAVVHGKSGGWARESTFVERRCKYFTHVAALNLPPMLYLSRGLVLVRTFKIALVNRNSRFYSIKIDLIMIFPLGLAAPSLTAPTFSFDDQETAVPSSL